MRPSPAAPPRTDQAAVLPSARVADGTWDFLLGCVALYILTGVGRVHLLFPILRPFKLVLVAGILSIGVYLLAARGVRDLARLWSRTTKYVTLLLLWVALSVPNALFQGASFRVLTDDFIKTVVMYLVIVGAVRGPRDVERLAFVYFLGAAVHAAVVLTRFSSTDDRLGRLYDYDPNDLATLIVTALPLGVYFLFGQRRLLSRSAVGAGLAVLTIAFVRTGSRGGFLALLAVGVFILVGYASLHLRWRVLGTVLLGLVFTLNASDSYWERMHTILNPEEDYNYTETGGRWQIWRRGLGYMAQHPLFGVGAGNFPSAEGTISPLARLQERGIGVRWSAAHNSYIQVGAELGVPGLVFFLGVILSTFGALRAVRRAEAVMPASARGPPRLSHALMASMVGFAVGACFLSLAYQAMLYTLTAFAAALRKVATAGARASSRPVPWRSA